MTGLMDEKDAQSRKTAPGAGGAGDRKARLASALRDNLRRRKTGARRAPSAPDDAPEENRD